MNMACNANVFRGANWKAFKLLVYVHIAVTTIFDFIII